MNCFSKLSTVNVYCRSQSRTFQLLQVGQCPGSADVSRVCTSKPNRFMYQGLFELSQILSNSYPLLLALKEIKIHC